MFALTHFYCLDGESSSQTIISQLLTDAIQSDDDLDEHEHFLTSRLENFSMYSKTQLNWATRELWFWFFINAICFIQ